MHVNIKHAKQEHQQCSYNSWKVYSAMVNLAKKLLMLLAMVIWVLVLTKIL